VTYPSSGSEPSYDPQRDYQSQGLESQPPHSRHGYEQREHYPPPAHQDQGHTPQGYAQPDYSQQPGYPQQVFPPQPDLGSLDAPPRKKRTALKVVLGVLAVLLVLCGVGGFIFAKPILDEYPATVTAGDSIAGFAKSTNAELMALGEQMNSELKQDSKLDSTAAGVYHRSGDPQRKIVMVIAGTGLLLAPETELKTAFESLDTGGLTVTGAKAVDPGKLGGTAKCGSATTSGVKLTVCGWADHGSLGIVMFFDRGTSEGAKLLLDFRKEIQQR
jgi:hypothetical protein